MLAFSYYYLIGPHFSSGMLNGRPTLYSSNGMGYAGNWKTEVRPKSILSLSRKNNKRSSCHPNNPHILERGG